MKVRVLIPFYATGVGIVKRGEAELPEELALELIKEHRAEEIKDDGIISTKPAAKGKTGTKSRNKRV